MKPRGRRITRVILGIGVSGLIAWRAPAVAREGNQQPAVSELIGRPAAELSWAPLDARAVRHGAVIYVYAESCPYCGVDHEKVRRSTARNQVPFVAAHLGPPRLGPAYWTDPAPQHLVALSPEASEAELTSVPILMVVAGDTVRAAWLGLLRWDEAAATRAIGCGLGDLIACVGHHSGGFVRGLAGRLRRLVRLVGRDS